MRSDRNRPRMQLLPTVLFFATQKMWHKGTWGVFISQPQPVCLHSASFVIDAIYYISTLTLHAPCYQPGFYHLFVFFWQSELFLEPSLISFFILCSARTALRKPHSKRYIYSFSKNSAFKLSWQHSEYNRKLK